MSSPDGELTDDQVRLIFILISPVGMALVGGLVLAYWSLLVEKMLEYQVIIPAAADPVLVLPRAAGAGLDGGRCWLAAAIVALVLGGVIAVGRSVAARRYG